MNILTGTYTVTVGAGGAGAVAVSANGSPGSSSVFSEVTTVGGGFGSYQGQTPGAGGSGGGSCSDSVPTPAGGAGTVGQGFAGGKGNDGAVQYPSGGGGGAARLEVAHRQTPQTVEQAGRVSLPQLPVRLLVVPVVAVALRPLPQRGQQRMAVALEQFLRGWQPTAQPTPAVGVAGHGAERAVRAGLAGLAS